MILLEHNYQEINKDTYLAQNPKSQEIDFGIYTPIIFYFVFSCFRMISGAKQSQQHKEHVPFRGRRRRRMPPAQASEE